MNHLAPFLLTNLLLDRLRESAPARVVTTASLAHTGAGLDLDDLQLEHGWSLSRSYGNSKLANILFTRALARRLEGNGVVANCFHPGVIRSRLARDAGLLRALAWRVGGLFFASPARGARTLVYLAPLRRRRGRSRASTSPTRSLRRSAGAPPTTRRPSASGS